MNNTQEKKLYYTVNKSNTELSHITRALKVLKKHRNSSGELVRISGDKYTISIENRLSVSLERLIKHYFEKDVYAVLNQITLIVSAFLFP